MSIKLRAWDHWNDEMIYSDKFDDLYGFFYSVKRREDGGNLVTLMLASNQWVHADDPIYEGDIIRFHYGAGDEIKTGIVECRPEHFCYWQVRIPGDHFGLVWATNCCTGMQVIGNRYADREWLEDEGFGVLLDEPESEKLAADVKPISFASPKLATQKSAMPESGYNDDFGRKIKEGDILIFKLCGWRFTGEVLKIFSPETAKSSWQVWTYDSPGMKLSLRHICEDVACTEVRVIGHISTVRRGGVAVQDIGIQL